VEFTVADRERGEGKEAKEVFAFQSRFALERFANIDEFRRGKLLDDLKLMADDEDWTYKQKSSNQKHPVLFNYVMYTFTQLIEQKKILEGISDGRPIACANTGLVSPHQEEIYAVFSENRIQGDKRKWVLSEFMKSSARKLGVFKSLPDIANYFDDPNKLIYDSRIELRVNKTHLLQDNIKRFPKSWQEDISTAVTLLGGALEAAEKRIRRNYKTAVPMFNINKLQLLLPLCSGGNKAFGALVVDREAEVYIGSTVLDLDMAYNNARLIARPDREWL